MNMRTAIQMGPSLLRSSHRIYRILKERVWKLNEITERGGNAL